MRGVRRGKSTGGHLRSEIVRGKSGRTNCRRATKLGPKVRLFKMPVPTVGFCDPARTASAILVLEQKWQNAKWGSDEARTEGPSVYDTNTYNWVL